MQLKLFGLVEDDVLSELLDHVAILQTRSDALLTRLDLSVADPQKR